MVLSFVNVSVVDAAGVWQLLQTSNTKHESEIGYFKRGCPKKNQERAFLVQTTPFPRSRPLPSR